jgi:hypothetical protein
MRLFCIILFLNELTAIDIYYILQLFFIKLKLKGRCNYGTRSAQKKIDIRY